MLGVNLEDCVQHPKPPKGDVWCNDCRYHTAAASFGDVCLHTKKCKQYCVGILGPVACDTANRYNDCEQFERKPCAEGFGPVVVEPQGPPSVR
jgi:hypothetical protein